jgi:hypothetical protein
VLKRILAALMVTTVSACGSPGGSPSPALSTTGGSSAGTSIDWRPEAGACHDSYEPYATQDGFSPADCAKPHAYQTIFVGDSGLDSYPVLGSSPHLQLWRDCDQRLTAFFGGPWREHRVKLRLSFSSGAAWSAGVKWYSCVAGAYADGRWADALVSASFKDGAKLTPELRLGCFATADGWNTVATARPCTEPHDIEFAGIVDVDVAWRDFFPGLRDQALAQCEPVVRAYTGGKTVSGTGVWHPVEDDWKTGDQSVRCFLWVKDRVSKSLRKA